MTSLLLHYAHIMFIADAVFAVYEASSLELWYFMDQAARNGAARSAAYIATFYVSLVFFLVILVQVCLYKSHYIIYIVYNAM